MDLSSCTAKLSIAVVAFTRLVEFTGENADALTSQLYAINNVGTAWYIIGAIGAISAVGILLYGKWLFRMEVKTRQPA